MDYAEIWSLAESGRQDLVSFAQRLVQTPSLSGQETEVADLLASEMVRLGYDKVWVDDAGNVIGHIAGGDGPSLMLNGHMDHVDAGDPGHWSHPPFDGLVHAGDLWGRGVADMKGALAAMVHAGGVVKKLGAPPPADLYVTGVVQEEVGGLGARRLTQTLPAARAVVGEASNNHLRRGHRGRVEWTVHFEGRSVHASMPHLGLNPHLSLARFVSGLSSLPMAGDPDLGVATVAPTRVNSEPWSANVTPAALHLVLDWRDIPSEGPAEIQTQLESLLSDSLEPGCQGSVELMIKELVTYTGFQMSYPDAFPSFTTAADHPWLVRAQKSLSVALEREVEVGVWPFTTDGGHFSAAGATVIGFGPGDASVVHTVQERLPIEQLVESVVGYAALSLT
jgi:succinyl-diaminopimelate desuccinylase